MSPTRTDPEATEPVTTVPDPARLNDQSTASRNAWASSRDATSSIPVCSRFRNGSIPAPVTVETGNTPQSVRLAISSSTSKARSASTRSVLVSATTPRETPSSDNI